MLVLAVSAALALSACSPVFRTAVRVNDDGTVDFASCNAVTDVTEAGGTTELRTGPNGQTNPDTEVTLVLTTAIADLDNLEVGQVVTFLGVPEEWDRMDLHVFSDDDSASAAIERENLTVGEWYWGDGAAFTSYVPSGRCDLLE